MEEVQQVYLPYDSADSLLLWLSLQSLFICFRLGRQERCAISQHEDHLDSICIFLVWKVCVWVCAWTECVSGTEPGSQSRGRFCAICYLWSLRFYAGCGSLLNWRFSCLTDAHFVFSCLSLCLCLSHTHSYKCVCTTGWLSSWWYFAFLCNVI